MTFSAREFHIAIAGPVLVEPLLPWLDLGRTSGATLPQGLGGVQVTSLVIELLRRGYRLTVVSLDRDVEDELRFDGPRFHLRLGRYRPRHRARDAFRFERRYLTRALQSAAPDIVHAHWSYEFALGALTSGVPTLVTVRDWAPRVLRLAPDGYRAARLAMAAVALRRASWLTATSPYIQAAVRRWARRPVALVPNAVDERQMARRDKPPDLSQPAFLAINNGFGSLKNTTTLLRAFRDVRAVRPGATLWLVGEHYEPRGPACSWATARGLDEGVEFFGAVSHDEVFALLRRADAFVHPSREESFGNVLVEAMAQGLPVVAGAQSGAVPWVLDEGRAGLLADVTATPALARSMLRLIRDEELWWQLSSNGYERVAATFALSSVTDQYLTCYGAVARDVAT